MESVRAQVTTRSGPPGAKDTPTIVQAEFVLHKGRRHGEFMNCLDGALEAAAHVAQDGMVTEVAVLIYPSELGLEVA